MPAAVVARNRVLGFANFGHFPAETQHSPLTHDLFDAAKRARCEIRIHRLLDWANRFAAE